MVPHGDPLAHFSATQRVFEATLDFDCQGDLGILPSVVVIVLSLHSAFPVAAFPQSASGTSVHDPLHASRGAAAIEVAQALADAHHGSVVSNCV